MTGELKFGKVLIVMGEIFFARQLIDVLKKDGAEVTFCSNAGNAVDALKEKAFELIICDTVLPHGEEFSPEETSYGVRTGQAILKFAKGLQPDIKMILLTGGPATEQDIKELGDDVDFHSAFDDLRELGKKFREEVHHA